MGHSHDHDDNRKCTCPRQGFNRQETMVLTDITSSRLSYLDRTGIVVPQKYGSHKKPHLIYSWEQVLQLRAITHLKQKISLDLTRKIVGYFNEIGISQNWGDLQLVIAGEDIFAVEPDWSDMPQIMLAAASACQDEFTVVVFPKIDCIVSDVWRVAIDSNLIDTETFVERAKKDAPVLLNC